MPNQKDRELVGTSMALNDAQIVELAKLPKGVAAVYQNDWSEAVLCHFAKYTQNDPFQYTPRENGLLFEKYFSFLFGIREKGDLSEEEVDSINDWIDSLHESNLTLRILRSTLQGTMPSRKEQEVVAYNIFEGKKIAGILAAETDVTIGIEKANKKIKSIMGFGTESLIVSIRESIMSVIFGMNERGELLKRYRSFELSRGQMI